MAGAQQRDHGGEAGVVDGMRHTEPDEQRRIGAAERGGRGLRVERRAEPSGHERGGGRA
jgi:hypothetical protein